MDRGMLNVGQVMRRDFVRITTRESLAEAQDLMRLARLRHLLVVDGNILRGVLSYRDVQDRLLASAVGKTRPGDDAPPPRIADTMVDAPSTVAADASLRQAASRMCHHHIGCLPVVEATESGPRILGIVTESDLLRIAFATS
jgi:CBS domain-containing protein